MWCLEESGYIYGDGHIDPRGRRSWNIRYHRETWFV